MPVNTDAFYSAPSGIVVRRRVVHWWKHVGDVLLTMPGLIFVELQMIRKRDELTDFWIEQVTTLSGGHPPGVRLEGKDNVVQELQELA